MGRGYSFKKLKITPFEVELFDGSIVKVLPPKIDVLDMLVAAADDLDENGDVYEYQRDYICDLISQIISRNVQKVEISKEYVSENFDVIDILGFCTAFFEWVSEVQSNPNSHRPTTRGAAKGKTTKRA